MTVLYPWVLIVIVSSAGTGVATAEFIGEKACHEAGRAVMKTAAPLSYVRYVCAEKSVK